MASNLKDLAYRSILRQIEKGGYPPGAFLPEVALARDLGMSRGPVREAVARLQSEGYLEQVLGRGSYVRLPDPKELEDIYQFREWLECAAVAEVATARRPGPALELRACHARMADLARAVQACGSVPEQPPLYQRFRAEDADMHGILLRAVGNEEVTKVVAKLRLLTRVFSSCKEDPTESIPSRTERTLAEHQQVIAAIEAGDAAAAAEAMRRHIRNGKRQAMTSLAAYRSPPAEAAPAGHGDELGRHLSTLRKYRPCAGHPAGALR